MPVTIITKEQLDTQIAEASKESLLILHFFAEWCSICKVLSPKVEELEQEIETVTVLKIDVDENQALALSYEVDVLPTFILVKNKTVLNKIVGSDFTDVIRAVETHK